MTIFKPTKLTDQQTILQHDGQYYAIISTGLSFDLEDPSTFLEESETQALISQYLPNILDEGWPKQRAEVMLVGTVPHPGKEGRYALRLQMQGIDKSLMVFAARKWTPGPVGTFVPTWDQDDSGQAILLSWNNAFGGKGYKQNPQGVGYAKGLVSGRVKLHEGMMLPQLETLAPGIKSPADQEIAPAGFSPVDMQDPRRLPFLGASAQYWQKEGGMPTLPKKFDFQFFQQAPLDQQREAMFQGGEPYRIEIGERVLEGALPHFKVRLLLGNKQFKQYIGSAVQQEMQADTVYFIPEADKGLIITRAYFPVNDIHMTEWEDIMLVLENPEQPQTDDDYEEQFLEYLEDSGVLKPFEIGLSPREEQDLPDALQEQAKANKVFASMEAWEIEPSEIASQELRIKGSKGVLLKESHFMDYDFKDAEIKTELFQNKSFNNATFTNIDFSGSALAELSFVGCQFKNCQFYKSQLKDIEWIECTLTNCDFREAELIDNKMVETQIHQSQMQQLYVEGTQFVKTDLESIPLQQSIWKNTQAVGGTWKKLDFEASNFTDFKMQGLMLQDSNFSHSEGQNVMMNGKAMYLTRLNFDQAKWQDSNLLESQSYRISLNQAEFKNTEWSGAKIVRSRFQNVNFQESSFPDTFFLGTAIEQCKLKGAILEGARFRKSNFEQHNNDLTHVNLKHVYFE